MIVIGVKSAQTVKCKQNRVNISNFKGKWQLRKLNKVVVTLSRVVVMFVKAAITLNMAVVTHHKDIAIQRSMYNRQRQCRSIKDVQSSKWRFSKPE